MKRWKSDLMIHSKKQVGEASTVTNEVTTPWLTNTLPAPLKKYQPRYVFNADELGSFWKLLPDRTHTFKDKKCIGGKRSKERITILLGANMDGSKTLAPLCIGKFAKPRAFER